MTRSTKLFQNILYINFTLNMDNLIGIRAKDYALIASDMTVSSSILSVSSTHNKFLTIYSDLILSHCGNFGDAVKRKYLFVENIKLLNISRNVSINCKTAGNLIQGEIHRSLRTNQPCQSSFMMIDSKNNLVAIDNYGLFYEDDYICQGYAAYFLYGLLDSRYKKDMPLADMLNLLNACLNLMKEKFLINYLRYKVMIIINGEMQSLTIEL